MTKENIFQRLSHYRFEFRHITVLITILIIFQIILSLVQKTSLSSFLEQTQKWYQQDSAEKIANLSATSLELLLENFQSNEELSREDKNRIIRSFNIIFSQQLLQQNVSEIFLILKKGDEKIIIDDGKELFSYLTNDTSQKEQSAKSHEKVLKLFETQEKSIVEKEQIYSFLSKNNSFHIFVPFVPHGEYLGVFYMRNTPDFTFITNEIISSYDEVAIIYSSLILLGLLAMYYISTYSIRERDKTQKLLFKEKEEHLKEQIMHEKESLFTKRIYHTHHKAEKVMGFIKEDLRELNEDNYEDIKKKVTKYSNFVSRVIYDMKWYDPPINTIRNPLFRTNINNILEFLVEHLFLRVSSYTDMYSFKLELDDQIPPVNINEFVVWEIIEPLIQNSIDHAPDRNVEVKLITRYFKDENKTEIIIKDDGEGIPSELLEIDENGRKKIFNEYESTKNTENNNSGYGCYIAYQMAKGRCGWDLDVQNNESNGCRFIITIKN